MWILFFKGYGNYGGGDSYGGYGGPSAWSDGYGNGYGGDSYGSSNFKLCLLKLKIGVKFNFKENYFKSKISFYIMAVIEI